MLCRIISDYANATSRNLSEKEKRISLLYFSFFFLHLSWNSYIINFLEFLKSVLEQTGQKVLKLEYLAYVIYDV